MNKVQKIREEVGRLQKRAEHNYDISLTENERQFWLGESNVLTLIGKYIDTMQEEFVKCSAYKNPQDCEIYPDCSDCMGNISEEPVSVDFEKALANEWKDYNDRGAATVDALEDNTQELAFAKGFYRGSNWQKAKDQSTIELAEDHAMLAGMEKMKEEMMSKAIDGEVGYWNLHGLSVNVELPSTVEEGDKVKVIVIKEE